MCERDDLLAFDRQAPFDWQGNRRSFAALGAAATLAACATGATGGRGGALRERQVTITTADGTMDAFFVAPAEGQHPAILTWPDIAGLREAFRVMARRLAGQGYAVLVANQYYRSGPAPMFADFAAFRAQNGFQKAGEMRRLLTPDAIMRDARAAIGWLDAQDAVDTGAGVGSNGYCMGGPFTVFTAAAVPARVRGAASLHGGGLVKEDDPQSPHRLLAQTQAAYLFAIAQNDDAESPTVKTVLREAAAAANRPAEVEVYAADHGWTVIDSPAYDQSAAERAWTRMSALFQTALLRG